MQKIHFFRNIINFGGTNSAMRNKKAVINFGYISLFLLITFIMLFPLWQPHQLVVLGDWSFHAARVEEIFQNLRSGQWLTTISARTFQGTGVGSFLFYPTPLLYLWAGLRFFTTPLTAFILWLGLLIWSGFTLSFFCLFRLTKNYRQALLFTLVYNLLPYRLLLGMNNFALAEFVATLFLPLVFLGFYQILVGKTSDWPLLALGMTLVLYTHLLTAVLATEIMFVILVIFFIYTHHFSKQQCCAMFKSIMLCCGLVLPILVPFITDFIGQSISSVLHGIYFLHSFSDVVLNSLGNQLDADVGILLLLPIIFYSKLIGHNRGYRLAIIIGFVLLLGSTNIVPWPLLSHTSLAVVQMPSRYLSYAGLFLAVGFSRLGSIALTASPLNKKPILCLNLILLITGGLYFGTMANAIIRNHNGDHLTALAQSKYGPETLPDEFLINNQNYATQFSYRVKYGETDYFPNSSLANTDSIINNQTYLNHQPLKLKKTVAANKISYTVKTTQPAQLNLPVINYRHTTLTVDGQPRIAKISPRGTVETKLSAGKHTVSVTYKPSIWLIISYLITVASWLGLTLVWQVKRHHK